MNLQKIPVKLWFFISFSFAIFTWVYIFDSDLTITNSFIEKFNTDDLDFELIDLKLANCTTTKSVNKSTTTENIKKVLTKPALLDENFDCQNLNKNNLTESKGIKNDKIAIIIVVLKGSDYKDYTPAVDSVKCYAQLFGYHLKLINMTDDERVIKNCNQSDIFFKRHCATVDFMEQHVKEYDYILFLDADIGIINPCHFIQDYIDDDKTVEITFYDRYYNDEIMAGSYLAKNSEYSRKFIKFWADYFYRLPNSFHGTDNGAIHQVFMEQHFKTNATKYHCYDLWKNSQNYDGLFTFQKCTRFALGDGSYYCDRRAKIIRKATWGWSRDGWLTKTLLSPSDFMFHGWKMSKLGGEWIWPFKTPIFDPSICLPGSSFKSFAVKENLIKTDQEIMGILEAKKQETRQKYIKTLIELGKICPDEKPPPFDMNCLKN